MKGENIFLGSESSGSDFEDRSWRSNHSESELQSL